MGNYIHSLGLDFLFEGEDDGVNFFAHVVHEGKGIKGYYNLPYFNLHFGGTQIIVRVVYDEESGKLAFSGFDSHADSLCVWNLRVVEKIKNEEDDPTRVKLLVRGMDGNNMLSIDVVNGDILPSFKSDEVIALQMVAFTDGANFYADEEAYAETVEPGPNGKKTMIAENTVFPVGLFSDSEDLKDVVQIHGTVKRLSFGVSEFGEHQIRTNIRCHVDTQLGEIVVIFPFDDIEDVKNNENMREGRVIDCFARLSGDAAIFDREEGVIHDAENNLRLVAYTLEDGDPKRLRSALADHFVYHSENAGVHFENVDEYLEFVQKVHDGPEVAHTCYATITEIEEGPELEYPIGTRCAVVSYESEEGFNSIIFVDTDEDGKISRIYLSRESRYRFTVDEPPEEPEDLAEMIANTTFQFSIIGRSHFHGLIDRDTGAEELEEYISAHKEELEKELSDIFDWEISEKAFSEAFLRGVRKSRIKDYKEEDIIRIGKQFHKDATLFKSEEEQKNIFHDALILVTAIGRLYIGRADREKE